MDSSSGGDPQARSPNSSRPIPTVQAPLRKTHSLSSLCWPLCPASPSAPLSSGPARGRATSRLPLTALEFFLWLVLTLALLDQIVRPLQTLTNVVGALREEDYSFRARGAAPNDALGELALEINALADILTEQRIQTIEATALLRRVVDEIDAPLFTFDPDHILRLVNAAGERLLQQPAARLLGKTAAELELNACFEARNETLVALPYSTPNARWMVRQSSFRQNGVPHTLIVLSDVSRALREEERSAWQRLIRVLGHELNNSLAPIISIAGSLASRLPLPQLPEEQNADFQRGLNIIESRTASLHRFLQSYRRLAQMPSPTLQPVELRPLLERVAVLETRLNVEIAPGPDVVLMIDPDLIEQMLINLVRNAVDAALEQAQSPSRFRIRSPEGFHAMGTVRSQGGADRGRQRHRPAQPEQCFRSVLYDQAGRLRHRAGPVAADRRGPRRLHRAGQSSKYARMYREGLTAVSPIAEIA